MRLGDIKITYTKSNVVKERRDWSQAIKEFATDEGRAFAANNPPVTNLRSPISEDDFYDPKRDGVVRMDMRPHTITRGMRRDELRFDSQTEQVLNNGRAPAARRYDSLREPINPSKLVRRSDVKSTTTTLPSKTGQNASETEIET